MSSRRETPNLRPRPVGSPVPVDASLEPLLCVSDRHVDWVGVFQQQVTCERGLTYRLLSIRQRSKDVYVPNVV